MASYLIMEYIYAIDNLGSCSNTNYRILFPRLIILIIGIYCWLLLMQQYKIDIYINHTYILAHTIGIYTHLALFLVIDLLYCFILGYWFIVLHIACEDDWLGYKIHFIFLNTDVIRQNSFANFFFIYTFFPCVF